MAELYQTSQDQVRILRDPRVGLQDIQVGDMVTPYDVLSWAPEPFLEVTYLDLDYVGLKGITKPKWSGKVYRWEVLKPTPHEIVLVKKNPNHFRHDT